MTKGPQRWRAICAYDGTDYYGWQSQVGGNTIQDVIEARIKVIAGSAVRIHGSGRTDSGVHAMGQVIHFDLAWKHGSGALQKALDSGLPDAIQVRNVQPATVDFHARFSASGKRYRYYMNQHRAWPTESRYCWSLYGAELDINAMTHAATSLLGTHDFSAFGAGELEPGDNPVKDLRELRVTAKGDRIVVDTEASGYLYKMVRSLVGALVEVGRGRLTAEDLCRIRTSARRTNAVPTAPAHGLFLMSVSYPGGQ